MPRDDLGRELCVELIDDYGVCSRTAEHIVHKMMGLSEREHLFKREEVGEYEEMLLTKRNIRKIARKSGKQIRDLEIMRQAAKLKGKTLTVKWKKEDSATDGQAG